MPSGRRQLVGNSQAWSRIIFEPGGGGTPGNSWWECAARFSKFQTPNFIFYSHFQTYSKIQTRFQSLLLRNYVIITQISERRKKIPYKNPLQIRISLFLSYSFAIETINVYIRFQTKTAPKQYPLEGGGVYLYGLNKGVLPRIMNSKAIYQDRAVRSSQICLDPGPLDPRGQSVSGHVVQAKM